MDFCKIGEKELKECNGKENWSSADADADAGDDSDAAIGIYGYGRLDFGVTWMRYGRTITNWLVVTGHRSVWSFKF